MYEIKVYATIDERKKDLLLDYMTKSAQPVTFTANVFIHKKDLEHTIKEMQWLTKR